MHTVILLLNNIFVESLEIIGKQVTVYHCFPECKDYKKLYLELITGFQAK